MSKINLMFVHKFNNDNTGSFFEDGTYILNIHHNGGSSEVREWKLTGSMLHFKTLLSSSGFTSWILWESNDMKQVVYKINDYVDKQLLD